MFCFARNATTVVLPLFKTLLQAFVFVVCVCILRYTHIFILTHIQQCPHAPMQCTGAIHAKRFLKIMSKKKQKDNCHKHQQEKKEECRS